MYMCRYLIVPATHSVANSVFYSIPYSEADLEVRQTTA